MRFNVLHFHQSGYYLFKHLVFFALLFRATLSKKELII